MKIKTTNKRALEQTRKKTIYNFERLEKKIGKKYIGYANYLLGKLKISEALQRQALYRQKNLPVEIAEMIEEYWQEASAVKFDQKDLKGELRNLALFLTQKSWPCSYTLVNSRKKTKQRMYQSEFLTNYNCYLEKVEKLRTILKEMDRIRKEWKDTFDGYIEVKQSPRLH